MAMNRREFIKRSAMVGAAVAATPIVLELWGEKVTAHPLQMSRPSGIYQTADFPLSLSSIQRTYGDMWYGNQHPTLVLMSPKRLTEFSNKIHPSSKFSSANRDFLSIRFLEADVAVGAKVPEDEIWFFNESSPRDPKMNGVLCFNREFNKLSRQVANG